MNKKKKTIFAVTFAGILVACKTVPNILDDYYKVDLNDKGDDKMEKKSLLLGKNIECSTPNKALRMVESFKAQSTDEEYHKIIDKIGEINEDASANEQGTYIESFLSLSENSLLEEEITKTMRSCGYNCIDPFTIQQAKTIYKNSENLLQFLEELNIVGIGGGNLHFEGDIIVGEYDRCYCNLSQWAASVPNCYCQCSAGWFEKLFSEVLEQQVEVSIVDTINNGADKCTFNIVL